MVRYNLDKDNGVLQEAGESEWDRLIFDSTNEIMPHVDLIDFKAFHKLGADLLKEIPHGMMFFRSMQNIQYCKLEKFSNCLLGTMKVPNIINNTKKEGGPFLFAFYLWENHLILTGEEEELNAIFDKIRDGTHHIFELRQLVLIILELLIQEDVIQLQRIEDALSELEETLLEGIPERFDEKMIRYRKNLFAYHAYYEQIMNMGDIMQDNLDRDLSEEECRAWEHFTARVERLHDHTEILREYAMQVRELYQSQIDVQQNKVITFLTIITTIFLPLTLIAGWYGMNFPQMPEFQWKYGYIGVIALSLGIVTAEIIYFKKKKML